MSSHPSRDLLTELAHAHRVSTDFWGYDGQHREVSDEVLIKVLAALGVDASTEEAVRAGLADAELAPWRNTLPPCTVHLAGTEGAMLVHVPAGSSVSLSLALEEGGSWELGQTDEWTPDREVDGHMVGRAAFILPADLPLGWHEVIARIDGEEAARAPIAVTPQRLADPPGERSWGMAAQLYSVRSRGSWGIGDLADLADLTTLFGEQGADFFQINPMHAAEPVAPMTHSPYLPVTRRFVNPIYIRPEAIPEVAYLTGPQRSLVEWAGEEERANSLRNEHLNRDRSWKAKAEALEIIFSVPRSIARASAFERFRAREGQGLEDFALWCALMEKYAGKLPEHLSSVDSVYVARERRELTERIDFFAWLQFIADEQLAMAQRAATASGMSMGVCADLAVGVHPLGSDVWSMPESFARGVTVGAPADMYNQQGQDWSQPPWRPDTLAATGYRPLKEMARTVMRHAGMLRVDHVAGFFRLWWIPDGHPASEGCYVNFDHEAMIGVLLLEAYRAGCVLVGEDLGTVEPWVRDYLAQRGIYGTSVLWFEKEADGSPLRPENYRHEVLASVNTHDLPPAAGYLACEHVDLRDSLGLLDIPVEEVRAQAEDERNQMVGRLVEYGLASEDSTERELVEGLCRYVARTPSRFVGLSLVDAVGERRTQNQPGTDQEYPNWRVPLADGTEQVVLVEDLPGNARLRSLLHVFRDDFSACGG